MQRRIIETEDGSSSIFSPEFNEHYHSTHGATSESLLVFIQNGFQYSKANPIYIFEVGFGTGLNAFLTLLEAEKENRKVFYHTIEKYPLTNSEIKALRYKEFEQTENFRLFQKMHEAEWNCTIKISENFALKKINASLVDYTFEIKYDLFYFDAFSPETQPELWTEKIFEKISKNSLHGGILTTYCCKGIVKRALKNVGFSVEKLPGPKGKREVLRAVFP